MLYLWRATSVLLLIFVSQISTLRAQVPMPIYDEAEIPPFTLPDPFVQVDGSSVKTAADWKSKRRPEIMEVFAREVYGRSPSAPATVTSRLVNQDTNALGGNAIREEVDITLAQGENPLIMRVLIYRPKVSTPVPAFLGLNFGGNHSIHADPAITLNENWMRNRPEIGYVNNKATEKTRGTAASRWPVDEILSRGYALATIYCGDIDPDFDDGFKNGIHGSYRKSNQDSLAPDDWGTIAAWAWGLSRALDYFETVESIDASRVAVIGHSRLGKTALWAGASDERFALTISNDSGCGGAALSRRRFGESVTRINTAFPHWFCDNFTKYNHNEDALPVDQHLLVAAIAPRPVYIASASEDQWADPHGEFLAAKYADPVFRMLGTDGLGGTAPPDAPPAADSPIKSGMIGYHLRTGKHDITAYDWQNYLDFADRHLKSK